MFKTKRVKQENVAAIPSGIPRPPQTIINQAPNEAMVFVVKAVVAGVGLFIGWHFLLYLLEEMRVKNPVQTIGYFLFGGIGLIIVSIAVDKAVTRMYKMKREYDLQLEEIRADRDRSVALTAAQPRPGESRLTTEDSKFAALLRVVMSQAYQHIYRNPNQVQQYGNRAKPWTRRACKGLEIPGFDKPVTEEMAGKVSTWLEEKGVIDDKGNINISEGEYPSFAHFEALLEREFYTPIQVQKALSPVIDRSGYEFIK